MVKRRNLRPDPARAMADLERRRMDAARQADTRPSGVKDLGASGDVVWSSSRGQQSVRDLPDALAQLAADLAAGISTTSRMNTVSTGEPAADAGYPEGALWTRVEMVDGSPVERARWVMQDGTWQPVGLDASMLVMGKIDAGLIDTVALAARLVTAGLIRTGTTGQRLEITPNGLILWGVDPDGVEYEMVRIGPSGTQLLTIGGATIDGGGNAVVQDLEARSVAVDGLTLTEHLAGLPQGVVARGYRGTTTEWRKTMTRVLEVPVTLQGGRTYRVSTSSIPFSLHSVDATVRAYLQWAPLPVTSLTQFVGISEVGSKGSAQDRLPPMSRIITTPPGIEKDYSFIVRTECPDNYHRVNANSGRPVELVVEDLGPALEITGVAWQDPAQTGTSSGEPVPPGTVQRGSLHRDSTAVGTYRRGSNGVQSTKDAVQGVYGSYGNREGMWLFNDMTGALAGATVEEVVLRFTITHTYASAGGIAEVRLHGNSTFPSGAAGLNVTVANVKVRAGGRYEVRITDPTICAGFKSGQYRGFGLSTDSTAADRYIRGQYASVGITYRK